MKLHQKNAGSETSGQKFKKGSPFFAVLLQIKIDLCMARVPASDVQYTPSHPHPLVLKHPSHAWLKFGRYLEGGKHSLLVSRGWRYIVAQ